MIQNVTVEGTDVQRVVFDKLVPGLESEKFEVAIVSLLTLAVMMMKPDISYDQLQEVVMTTSEHLILQLADGDGGLAN